MTDDATTQPSAFREGELLGSGGMAEIRACFVRAPWGEIPRAIKRLEPDRVNTDSLTAFEREARLALTERARAAHPYRDRRARTGQARARP